MTPRPNDLRGDGRRTDVVWSRINDPSTCTAMLNRSFKWLRRREELMVGRLK
jgi:hypothetical protein